MPKKNHASTDGKEKNDRKQTHRSLRKDLRERRLKIHYSFIKILSGFDLSIRRLPLMHIKSVEPGPVVWLTSCMHGDEVGGIAVIQEVFKKIKKKGLRCGEVYAFPLMNPLGFETASRNVTISMEDLNRSFIGSRDGSLAERIAYNIFNKIIETRPTLVLDLHNDWRESVPYTVIDLAPESTKKQVYEKTKEFAQVAGFPIVLEEEYIEKSLTHNLLENDIPSLTLEMGESFCINETDVENGVRSIWNLLMGLGMVDNDEEFFRYPAPKEVIDKFLIYSQKTASSKSGVIRFIVRPGQMVKKNQPIARVYNVFGKQLEVIKAADSGFVLGYSDSSVSFPGLPIMAFGLIE